MLSRRKLLFSADRFCISLSRQISFIVSPNCTLVYFNQESSDVVLALPKGEIGEYVECRDQKLL